MRACMRVHVCVRVRVCKNMRDDACDLLYLWAQSRAAGAAFAERRGSRLHCRRRTVRAPP